MVRFCGNETILSSEAELPDSTQQPSLVTLNCYAPQVERPIRALTLLQFEKYKYKIHW
jgi:hypothetical protein